MARRIWRGIAVCSALFAFLATVASSGVSPQTGGAKPTWTNIAPILAKNCASCHSGSAPAGGLGLDALARLRKGGSSGPAIKPGSPSASLIVKRIKGTIQPRMPLGGAPLPARDIAAIEAWIAAGAPAGANASAVKVAVPKLPPAGAEIRWKDVPPIFGRRCVTCHAAKGQLGPPPEGYRLDTYAQALRNDDDYDRRGDDRRRGGHGGDREDRGRRGREDEREDGPRIVPGNPNASRLVRMIKGQDEYRMPPKGSPLTADEIRVISDWIRQGARN